MRVIFVVVALLVSTTAAFEEDHLKKLKIASRELMLAGHLETEGIKPANLDRGRRGSDPQCPNFELQVVQNCGFNIDDAANALSFNVLGALTVKEVNDIICSNDLCYNAVLNYFQMCDFQNLATLLEAYNKLHCLVNSNGTYCYEVVSALFGNTSNMCFQSPATCRSDQVCNEYFNNLIKQYGCCMKELTDLELPVIPGYYFFEFCGLPNPGNCPSTNTSVNSTTSTVHPFARCESKAREFANMRGCSAGLDFRYQLLFRQRSSSCERQLFFSRMCRSQKCLNSFVDMFEECLIAFANGLNITTILDEEILENSKLLCAKDPERKDFCGVMFPEFSSTLEPRPFNLTCAIQEGTGSCSSDQECVDTVNSAIDHYGCCLSSYLKISLKVNPKKLYERCGVNPPDPCRTKLKDPRRN